MDVSWNRGSPLHHPNFRWVSSIFNKPSSFWGYIHLDAIFHSKPANLGGSPKFRIAGKPRSAVGAVAWDEVSEPALGSPHHARSTRPRPRPAHNRRPAGRTEGFPEPADGWYVGSIVVENPKDDEERGGALRKPRENRGCNQCNGFNMAGKWRKKNTKNWSLGVM